MDNNLKVGDTVRITIGNVPMDYLVRRYEESPEGYHWHLSIWMRQEKYPGLNRIVFSKLKDKSTESKNALK